MLDPSSNNPLPAHLRISYRIPTIFNRPQNDFIDNSSMLKRRRIKNRSKQKIRICRFSPFEPLIAVIMQDDCSVAIWSYEEQDRTNTKFASTSRNSRIGSIEDSQQSNEIRLMYVIRHTRPIDQVIWLEKHPSANQGQTRILLTRTNDQVCRIWTTTIDDMHSMHLSAIVDDGIVKSHTNTDILGLSIEQWDQVQRKRNQFYQESIKGSSEKSPLHVWRQSEHTNSLLAIGNGVDLTILSPQRFSLWQRSLLSSGVALKNRRNLSTTEQSQSDLNRLGVIANLNLSQSFKTSKSKIDPIEDPDIIQDIHWISDDHILIAMRNQQKAILLDGTKIQQKSFHENRTPQANSLSHIAKLQSLPLPVGHIETLIRCAYWGQLSMAMQIILKSCLDDRSTEEDDDQMEIDQKHNWPDRKLIIDSSPAERQSEMNRLIADDEEKVEMTKQDEDSLVEVAIKAVTKEQQKWSRSQGTKEQDNILNNKTSTVVNILFDMRKLIGQLDDSAIRYALNSLFSCFYGDQFTLSSPFANYESPLAILSTQIESTSTLSGRSDYDPILTKSCLHAWFSSTQEALFQYVESTMLIRISNGSKSDDLSTAIHNDKPAIKMDWGVARKLGIFLWLRNNDQLRQCAEQIAKVQYTADEKNDPTACALLYYAMGKHKLVYNLWRQSVWHPEYNKMMKFLKNDFGEQRWKSAAQKNAFVLLSQRRFEMAAAFFLLGDSLQDAVNVCIRNLWDISLAIAICRIWPKEQVGLQIFTNLVIQVILPLACKNNDRFTLLWATEVLERRDLSKEIVQSTNLNSTFKKVADEFNVPITQEQDRQDEVEMSNLKDVDDLFYLRSIEQSSNESDFVDLATESLRQDGLVDLANSLKRDWKQKEGEISSQYRLFDCAPIVKPVQDQSKEDSSILPIKPAHATQLVKSDLLSTTNNQSKSVSAADLAFDLDSWGM